MSARVEKGRNSIKKVIHEFADELLNRKNDPEAEIKLKAIETIALRANWTELYERLHYRKRVPQWWQDKD